jgi:hypothetical protein
LAAIARVLHRALAILRDFAAPDIAKSTALAKTRTTAAPAMR